MTQRRLYAVTLPPGVRLNTDATSRQEQQIQAILGGDVGAVSSVGQAPEERALTVEFPGRLSRLRASELRETGKGLSEPIPLYGTDDRTPEDGYYTVSAVQEARPVDPRSEEYQRVRVGLTREGTISSHWRQVSSGPADVSHPFGSRSESEVAVPSTAIKVRWFNAETGQTEQPNSIATRQGRAGSLMVYDATNASFSSPDLIYELPYREEGLTDPRVFDTLNQQTRFGGGREYLRYQKVFAASHRFRGERVIENELLRLTVDEESAPGIAAQEFSGGSFSRISIPQGTGWEILDWDIRTITTVQVAGVAEFSDGTTTEAIRWQLQRGAKRLLIEPVGSLPSGLQNLLSPIAADYIKDAFGGTTSDPHGLRSRSEVVQ